jgi:hypothetical protein
VSDLTRLSASLLREKIAAKKVSPVELTETVLARAESSTIQDHRYRESHSPLTGRGWPTAIWHRVSRRQGERSFGPWTA